MIRILSTAALLCAGLVASCGPQPGSAVPPYPPMPPPVVEQMPKPPVSPEVLVWQPGSWNWTGSGYEWQPGQYVPAAGHGNLWRPGWWTMIDGGWEWVPPGWVIN